jgi:hypothetical protein
MDKEDIRILALLFWQARCYMDTGEFVPLVVNNEEEVERLAESVRRLHSDEMVDAMQPKSGQFKGMPMPIPNSKGCQVLHDNPDVGKLAMEQFAVCAMKHTTSLMNQMREGLAKRQKLGRKGKR